MRRWKREIKLAQTKWSGPVTYDSKNDEILRFFADDLNLVDLKKRKTYCTLQMDQRIESRGKPAIFSTLDENRRYCKKEMEESGQAKTTFLLHHRFYRLFPMPFVHRNVPGNFRRTMKVILAAEWWQSALVNMNDVVTFSILKEHNCHIREVLTVLNIAGVTVKLKNGSSLPKPLTNWNM